MTGKRTHNGTFFNIRHDILVCLFLIITSLATYWQLRNHEFLNYDDAEMVTENPHVVSGLTSEGITWSFSFKRSYWHPLSWLSHMLDCELFGLDSGWHHLTSLIFHTANAVLLFIALKWMTGAVWKSAFAAALFALHPLNVESVAWIAQRLNVLSTFFCILTILTYAHYAKRPGLIRYLVALLCFGLGLMAKPILMTIPFVLLLLDYWPLGRIFLGHSVDAGNLQSQRAKSPESQRPHVLLLVLEKIPFLAIAIAVGLLSFLHVRTGDFFEILESFPLKLRIANALVSYVSYIGKMIWPQNLAVFYPYRITLPMWQAAGACLLLISISLLLIRAVRRHPYLAVGWLWYIVGLLPVIGLVHVGSKAMADRYAYVPLIGIFIIIAWGVPELVARWRYRSAGLATIASVALSLFMATTMLQLRYWSNSITLFEHALAVTTRNFRAHYGLAAAFTKQGRTDEIIRHSIEALRIMPNSVHAVGAHYNLGAVFTKQDRITEAIYHFSEALRLNPKFVPAHNNLGLALTAQGKLTEAIKHYHEALRIDPNFVEAHNNLGSALMAQGKTEEAILHYTEALRLNPKFLDPRNNLGLALTAQGKTPEAIKHYHEALRINPYFMEAHNNLANAMIELGRIPEAIKHYSEAFRLNPHSVEVCNNLGAALFRNGNTEEAIAYFRKALQIKSDYADAHDNLKRALAAKGKIDGAIAKIQEKLKLNAEDPTLHHTLGNLYKNKGKLDKAIEQYQKALSIQPGFIRSLNNLAMVYTIKGEYDKAVSAFKKIIDLQPETAGPYYNIACLFSRQNRVEDSINWLKEAIKRGYKNWDLLKTDKDLENIRGSSYYREIMQGR